MLTVRTSENTVITSFRLISERQDFSSVRTGENTVRARARIQVDTSGKPLPLDKRPFYIMPATVAVIATYCGLRINKDAKVQNIFGEFIPGLWAAGEMTGGVHGAGYMSGSAFGKALTFGRIAAKDIAKQK